MKKDLTQLEILHLPEIFNLTDGHAHRTWDKREQAIVANMTDQFVASHREEQLDLEADYIAAFYKLAKQTVDTSRTKYLFLQSASMSLEAIANYLRLQGLSLALTEPCFDNLANIFKRHDVELEPIPDHLLEAEEGFDTMLRSLRSDAICIVSPNNPTGITYTKRNFETLVEFCKQKNKLLILDSCFRMYKKPQDIFDEYQLLQQSGIDYIIVEDTGKTWPTQELKVSMLAMSTSLYQPLFDIYTDFIFHHSPFVIRFLTEFIKNSLADDLEGIRQVVQANRLVLREAIKGTILSAAERDSASIAWLKIDSDIKAAELEKILGSHGVFVLPGNQFFWSDQHKKGDAFIRVGLVRDPEVFARAAKRIREALDTV